MAGRIPDETLQTIRDRTSIVEIVSSYVSLKRAGRNHLGLCPFHAEKTPSFTVNEERGLFHCFGCGVGGTVFTFLMRIERIEFPEAVEQLAKLAGVALPQLDRADASARRERLYQVNERAARFFQQQLEGAAGCDARAYLKGRGLGIEIIGRYGIGFAPPSGSALAAVLAQEGALRDAALEVGLLGRRADGSTYDRFRGRVMFPIRDRRGRLIGFGGRTLGTEQPKYLNSCESPAFYKGEGLYGLWEARDAIRTTNRVVVVEGYMDVLQLAQQGIPYAVAVLGTALTERQLLLLRPFGGDELLVYFFFDGDAAGRKAAKRACAEAFKACTDAGLWGRAAFLPSGLDPDSYVRAHGAGATLALLDQAAALEDVYFDCVAPGPGASLQERARVAEEVREVLASAKSDVQRRLLAERAETRLGLKEDLLRGVGRAPQRKPEAARAPRAEQRPAAELLLIETMAACREAAHWVAERGTLGLFQDAELAAAGERLAAAWSSGEGVEGVVESLPAQLSSRLTAAALGGGYLAGSDPMQIARDCEARIRERTERAVRRAAIEEVRRARDGDQLREKLRELNRLRRGVGDTV